MLLLTVPVPFWFLSVGSAPTLALLQITGHVAPVWLFEGGDTARLVSVGLGIQALLWTTVLYFGAGLLARGLAGIGGGRASTVGVLVVVVGLFVVSLFPVYVSPLIARGAPVNLLNVY